MQVVAGSMGRRGKSDSVDLYFDKISTTAGPKPIGLFKCKCCELEAFRASSRTRLVAHLVGISGQGVGLCTQSLIAIPAVELRAIALSTETGKRHLEVHGQDNTRLTASEAAPSVTTASSSGDHVDSTWSPLKCAQVRLPRGIKHRSQMPSKLIAF